MPRIGINELTSINQDSLELEIAKAEWLLHGNMDGDNLLWSGNNHVTIPQGKIQDSPFNGNPVYGNKLFTSDASSLNIYDDIWLELFNILTANPSFTLALAEASFSFTPLRDGVSGSSQLTQTTKVEKPAHHKLLYKNSEYTDYEDVFLTTPYYRPSLNPTTNHFESVCFPAIIPMFTATYKLSSSKAKGVDFKATYQDNQEDTSIIINWNVPPLEDGEYIYAGFRFLCLYRVLL